MGFVLALIARHRRASIDLFTDGNLRDPVLRGFAGKVSMSLDPAIDKAYPGKWMSTVELETRDGRILRVGVESAKGDPDKPLTREEIKGKAMRLTQSGCPGLANQLQNVADRVYHLHHSDARIEPLFSWGQDTARQVAG
jgi:2-methylcitrate dehydratase PrpD